MDNLISNWDMRCSIIFFAALYLASCSKDSIHTIDTDRNTANPGEVEIKHNIIKTVNHYYEYRNCFALCRNQADLDSQLLQRRSQIADPPPEVDFTKFSLVFISGHAFVGDDLGRLQVFTYLNKRKKRFRLEVRMDSYYDQSTGSGVQGKCFWIRLPRVPQNFDLYADRLGFLCP
jgi:hypothetical protein